jgi:phosphoribosylformylglycinamidine (FGAM) synthase-like enzyme
VFQKASFHKVKYLFEKHELDSAVIGEVTNTDRFVLKYEDEVFADIQQLITFFLVFQKASFHKVKYLVHV